ncbi:MAG: hypothetical protein WCK00_14325, partial [Deltaproteobacteria bacterium]
VTCEEGIFDRTANFSCTYYFLCDVKSLALGGFRQMVVNSGLFSYLTSSPTWDQWALSQAPVVGVRGYQGLVQSASSDAIIDVCGAGTTIPWTGTYNPGGFATPPSPELGIANQTPNTETSWLTYSAVPTIYENSPNCRQAILQAPPTPEGDIAIDATVSAPSPGSLSGPKFANATGTPDVIQQNGQPRYSAIVRGYATRAGYPIPRPNYATIGAATTTHKHTEFNPWTAGNYLGVVLYAASWTIWYDLDKSPGQVGVLMNPEQGNPGV